MGASDDDGGVAVEVSDAGVHLGEGEAQLGHVATLQTSVLRHPWRVSWA